MPALARIGIDSAGGIIIGPGAPSIKVNGATVAVLGDAITPHGTGAHANAVIVTASGTVNAEGIPAARVGDLASCGHTITGGSPDTFADDLP